MIKKVIRRNRLFLEILYGLAWRTLLVLLAYIGAVEVWCSLFA